MCQRQGFTIAANREQQPALLDERRSCGALVSAPRGASVKQWHLRHRRGLTLIEVLMSIFVLSVGLFGVAALLPLGQKKMIEGSIDQRKAQVAESAFEYLGSQGGLNPGRWISAAGAPYDAVRIVPATGAIGRVLCPVATGSTASAIITNSPNLSTQAQVYNDSVIEFRTGRLRGQRRVVGTYTVSGAAKTLAPTTALPADPYAGDTLGTDANSNGRYDPGDTYTDDNNNGVYDAPDTFVVIRARPFAIDPLLVGKLGTAAGDFFASNMPRMTLSSPAGTVTPMPLAAAEALATADDDYIYATPSGSDPPSQVYVSEPYIDVNNNGVYDSGVDTFTASQHDMNGNGSWDGPLKRKSELNLSWAATLVPTMGGNTEQYRVSVVVFYKRPLEALRTIGANSIVGSEPIQMEVQFGASGLGGGAALLRADVGSATAQEELKPVRAGHWILVSSANGREHRWYRISSIGPAYQDSGRWTRNVSLAGTDWNTTTVADQTAKAVYYPGVVGVFERNMPIETLPDTSN